MVLGSFLAITDMVIILCMYICSNKKDDWPETLLLCLNSTLTWLKQSQTTESKKQLPLFQQNVITHSQLGPKGSEVIGWRLATQESCSGFHFTKELSPAVLNKSSSKGQYRYWHTFRILWHSSNVPTRLANFKL